MASILAKLAVEIVANTASFAAGLDKASAKAQKFEKQVKTVGAAVLGAIAFKEIGQAIINTTTQFEKFGAVLQNALGSRSAASEALNRIKKFAAETPFEVAEITAAFVRWTNQGLNPSIEKMRMIGDVASSLGAGFEQTAEAFKDLAVGQTKRIEEIGISAQQANGKIQLSFKGVNLEIEKNAKGVDAALNLYAKLPGVLGTSAAIAATMGGKISNLKDNLTILAGTIGNSSSGLINGFLDFANNALGSLNDALNKQSDALREEQIELNVLVGAITDANTSEAARSQLIDELNRKYPDFLKNLNVEKVTNEELRNRLDAVNQQFLKKIALAAAEEKLIEKQKELNSAIDDEIEARKRAEELKLRLKDEPELLPSGQINVARTSFTADIAVQENNITKAKKEQAELQKELTDLVVRYQSTWANAANAEMDYFQAKGKNAKETNNQLETTNELTKEQKDKLKEEAEAWKELMQARSMSFEDLKKQYKESTINVAPLKADLKILGDIDRIKKAQDELKNPEFLKAPEGIQEYIASLKQADKANFDFRQTFNDAFGASAQYALDGFIQGLSEVAEGNITFGENINRALIAFMKMFGQNLLKLALGAQALKNLFATPVGAAVAIGAAAVLIGAAGAMQSAMNKKAQNVGSGGGGGGSFTAQTINASSMQNNIQISGQLVGSGRDLVAVINNTSFDNKVRKGG